MTGPILGLIPSPFVGASIWDVVAARIPGAIGVDYQPMPEADPYGHVARRCAAAMAGAGRWIAVLHSGAGGFAPILADRCEGLAGFVFVDAVRPHPGESVLDRAAPDFAARLRGGVENGRLAHWNAWFDEDPTPRLIPDEPMRARLTADLPRTPLAFVEAPAPGGESWAERPAAYLQLSRLYGAQADWAEARGWPVTRLSAHHLAMTTQPDAVAGAILELVEAMAVS